MTSLCKLSSTEQKGKINICEEGSLDSRRKFWKTGLEEVATSGNLNLDTP